MKQPYVPTTVTRKRGLATSSGSFFAIIAAIIIFGIVLIDSFRLPFGTEILNWALLFALFGTPLLAGFLGMLRSGYIGTGVLAGVWNAFLVGIFLSLVILIVTALPTPASTYINTVQSLQTAIALQGFHITIPQVKMSILHLLFVDFFIIIYWLGLGAILGLIGSLIGRIFVHHPRDIVYVPAIPGAPPNMQRDSR